MPRRRPRCFPGPRAISSPGRDSSRSQSPCCRRTLIAASFPRADAQLAPGRVASIACPGRMCRRESSGKGGGNERAVRVMILQAAFKLGRHGVEGRHRVSLPGLSDSVGAAPVAARLARLLPSLQKVLQPAQGRSASPSLACRAGSRTCAGSVSHRHGAAPGRSRGPSSRS